MQVIATAGHVDHGKSALVRALTGMEPDRWAEERRRGLTIDLGYAWLVLPSGERVAFVDVPGHERFVPNMLAGVGPVPAVLFVVAADEGWMPQSAEHLAAIDALGISHGLLVVTRSDLADPAPALRAAAERIAATSMGEVEAVAVSAVTGQGMPDLLAALSRLVSGLPEPDPSAAVRLWVDRAFSVRGSGTVATGTLPAGTVAVNDELLMTPSLRRVRVRGLQSLKESAARVSAVARVAVNLRGVDAGALRRGMALVTAGEWTVSSVVDVRLGPPSDPPRELILHIGAARTTARVRQLSGDGAIARLTLRDPLPFHVGERVLLRLPGAVPQPEGRAGPSWPPLAGATVLDISPPALAGRGSAAAAGRELASWPAMPTASDLLRRRGLLREPVLHALGVADHPAPVTGNWLADPGMWAALRERLTEVIEAHAAREPLAPGMPVEAARAALGLPDRRLVEALVSPPLVLDAGLLRVEQPAPAGSADQAEPSPGQPAAPAGPAAPGPAAPGPAASAGATRNAERALPERVVSAVRALRQDLAVTPFRAPDAGRLSELGLDTKALAAAARAGLLLRVSEQIVLAPGADGDAVEVLAGLPQPFTTAQARQVLDTTRRVAIPLLEYLDRAGITQRLPDDRRRLTQR